MAVLVLLVLVAVLCIPGTATRFRAVLQQILVMAILAAVWITVTGNVDTGSAATDMLLGIGAMFTAALVLRLMLRRYRR